MIQVTVPEQMEIRLVSIAEHDGKSVLELTLSVLEDFLQHREDSLEADDIMARNEPLIPWSEARKQLGLDS